MIFWIVIVVFAVPLYLYIRKARSEEIERNDRLDRIQSRLQEKKLAEIEKKKRRISSKNGSIS